MNILPLNTLLKGCVLSYKNVSSPQGMTINMPFNVQRIGSRYRVDPSFNIRTRANITVTTEGYVDSVAGNDSNDGLSESTPLKTLTAANAKGWDRIYLKRGSEFQKNQRPTELAGDVEVVTYGTGEKPRITSLVSNQIGSFSNTSNYYSATAGDYVAAVLDSSILNANGKPTAYTRKASIAEVDAEAGTFYWNASTVYIRTLDDRAPDSDLSYYDSLAYRLREDNRTQYFENIEFQFSAQFEPNSATGGAKVYFKDCNFYAGGYQFWGLDECIIMNCDFWSYGGDVINIDDKLGVTSNVYEVYCSSTNYQSGDPSSQCSTTHGTSNVVRIGCNYQDAAGQVIADTGTGQSWIMGMTLDNGGSDVTTYFSNTAWLEGNTISGDATSIQVDTTGSVFYKNNTLAGSVTETGIYAPYIENSNYLAYIAKLGAETITAPSTLQQYLGNRLVVELDALGSVYDSLMISAQDGSKEASSVSPYRTSQLLTLNGTLTFTADSGLLGDGSTGYIDTNFNPSQDGGNYTQDSACIFGYISTANVGNNTVAGYDGSNTELIITNAGSSVQRMNTTSNWGSVVDFSGTGFFMICRTASGEQKAYNGTTEYTSSVSSTPLPDANIEILRRSEAIYGDCEIGLFGIGSGALWDNREALRDAVLKYFNDL